MKKYQLESVISKINITHIFFIALILRLLALLLAPNPMFPDAATYHTSGAALFHGAYFSNKVMPLYPIISYLTGGTWGLKLLDVVLSALTVILIYKISLKLFDHKVAAILAAICTAIYPYFIFYSISGLTETSFVFFLCLAFYCFYAKHYFWAAVASVLTILIRPLNDLLTPILMLTFILLVHRDNWKIALKWVFLYLIIYGAMMAPWWIYNYNRYHTFVRTNLGTGIVVYAGNNPMNHSGGGIAGVDVDANKFSVYKNPVKRNQAMIDAGIHYAITHPWHMIKLDGIKFLRFWRLYPYTEKYKNPMTITVSLLSYGVILLLCIIYLFRHLKRDWKKLSPILIFSLYLMAGCMLSVASLRYRLPIEPFIIILACYTLSEWIPS